MMPGSIRFFLFIIAVRLGRGDVQGANHAFVHAAAGTVAISLLLISIGMLLQDDR